MTFLEAIKARRPMRRPWVTGEAPWIWLGRTEGLGNNPYVWREIDNGLQTGLSLVDYEATDWEVMP